MSNEFENLILTLLAKQPFERNFTHSELRKALLETPIEVTAVEPANVRASGDPEFWYRLLPNEKSVVLDYLDSGGAISGIEYVANYLPMSRSTLGALRSRNVPYILDPATNRLAYSTFSQTKGLVALPYCWDKFNRLTPEALRDVAVVQKYAREAIDWQRRWRVSTFVSPFHFHRNLADEWLNIDLKLLREAVAYVKETDSDTEVLAGLCFNIEEYTTNTNRLALLNRASLCRPDGYIFYGDEITETTTNPARLYAYAALVMMFSGLGKRVVAARMGTLGLGMLAIGAQTATSGLASLTGFSEQNLLKERQKGYTLTEKYYIPRLLLTLPVALARDIIGGNPDLACSCRVCTGTANPFAQWKAHYMEVRRLEVEELTSVAKQQRPAWFAGKVEAALAQCTEVAKRTIELRTTYYSHLKTWLGVFGPIAAGEA